MSKAIKQLYRSRTNRKIAGICGGLGEYFQVDPTFIRILFIIVALASVGLGILAYLIMWLIIPKESEMHAKKKMLDNKKEP